MIAGVPVFCSRVMNRAIGFTVHGLDDRPRKIFKLEQGCVEDAHKFAGTVGDGEKSAPCSCGGNAKAVLSVNVGSDVVFGAN